MKKARNVTSELSGDGTEENTSTFLRNIILTVLKYIQLTLIPASEI